MSNPTPLFTDEEFQAIEHEASTGNSTAVWDYQKGAYAARPDCPLTRIYVAALHDLADKSNDLSRAAAGIARDMERLQGNIQAGYSVNNLGELQSQGPRLDILCAERGAAARQVRMTGNMLWHATGEQVSSGE